MNDQPARLVESSQNTNQRFYKLFLALFLVNAVLISAAITFYNGAFDGLTYPFSYAGDFKTVAGDSNTLSMGLYSLDMIVSGGLLLTAAYKFFRENGRNGNITKPLLFVVAGSGFLIASISPDDIRHPFHVLGSAIAIASLWIIATNYLFEVRNKIRIGLYYILQAILQLSIFGYAGTYFLNIDPLSYILQKIALFGLCIALIYSAYIKEAKN